MPSYFPIRRLLRYQKPLQISLQERVKRRYRSTFPSVNRQTHLRLTSERRLFGIIRQPPFSCKKTGTRGISSRAPFGVSAYFSILNFPMIGSSFARPFAAFIIPITSITRNTRLTSPIILVMKYSRHEIARMMLLKTPYVIP